jgi:ribose 5-phosphate isomerase A
MNLSWVEGAKRKAVLKALQPVRNGWIIGLGSGSTMAYAAIELARLSRARKLELSIVPTSHQIENLAIAQGLEIQGLNEAVSIDYAIDGADQVQSPSLNLIKGGGAALLREKVVDSAAQELAIVVDETKLSKKLGGTQKVPLEVLPFAYKFVQAQVAKMEGRARLREGNGKVGPVVTDNGNFILDADFGVIENASALDRKLKAIPGVLETGLFLGMTDVVFVGKKNAQVDELR